MLELFGHDGGSISLPRQEPDARSGKREGGENTKKGKAGIIANVLAAPSLTLVWMPRVFLNAVKPSSKR